MKKVVISLVLAMSSNYALAFSTADSRYEGTGHSMSSTGVASTYAARVEIVPGADNDVGVLNTYTLENGSRYLWNYTVRSGDHGMFAVWSQNTAIGNGYCMDLSENAGKWCHYSLKFDNLQLEESIIMKGNNLFRMGSKYLPATAMKYMWRETLSKLVPAPTPEPTPSPDTNNPAPAPLPNGIE
ncbi:MAG: hypothetical protein KA436_07440 [Oligoflexales bacterium]|nr:hypothetical protein [Oligoflexales bacterium]